MKSTTKLYQCKLSRKVGGVLEVMSSWIDSRGATVGVEVELLPNDGKGMWKVDKVFTPPVTAAALQEKQSRDRNSLPSIMES